jgi:ferredoxin--NADP+ reductase
MRELPADEYLGELIRSRLIYFPTVTREPFKNRGRITELMAQPDFYAGLGLADLSVDEDRAMLCGSPEMLGQLKEFFLARRFTEGNTGEAGDFVVEKAFVES